MSKAMIAIKRIVEIPIFVVLIALIVYNSANAAPIGGKIVIHPGGRLSSQGKIVMVGPPVEDKWVLGGDSMEQRRIGVPLNFSSQEQSEPLLLIPKNDTKASVSKPEDRKH